MKAPSASQNHANPARQLHTVNQFCGKHPFVTQGGMRYQIFNSGSNGLDDSGALIRVGRKILIDEEKYFSWIDSQQKGGGKGGV